jgi:hypothetical protein
MLPSLAKTPRRRGEKASEKIEKFTMVKYRACVRTRIGKEEEKKEPFLERRSLRNSFPTQLPAAAKLR